MPRVVLNRQDKRAIESLVREYQSSRDLVRRFQLQLLSLLQESDELSALVHSYRGRMKSEESLRDKLRRKLLAAKEVGGALGITAENLLTEINDLAGLRVLHLYPRQIREIDGLIRALLEEERLGLRETPFARTWDDEYREYFRTCGFDIQSSPSLYTSVHYVVESSSRRMTTCEIQVRTLMEEVWGEVDHTINYPHEVDSVACREQLKVLARVTSSATRLVDSIFLTFGEHRRLEEAERQRRARRRATRGKRPKA